MEKSTVSITVSHHHVAEETESSTQHQSTGVDVWLTEYSLRTVRGMKTTREKNNSCQPLFDYVLGPYHFFVAPDYGTVTQRKGSRFIQR